MFNWLVMILNNGSQKAISCTISYNYLVYWTSRLACMLIFWPILWSCIIFVHKLIDTFNSYHTISLHAIPCRAFFARHFIYFIIISNKNTSHSKVIQWKDDAENIMVNLRIASCNCWDPIYPAHWLSYTAMAFWYAVNNFSVCRLL